MFTDRTDAGTQLAKQLLKFKNQDVIVLAIPRGGLPLGAIVAKTLNAPLDVALSKKIGHPYNKEYAIGAVGIDTLILTDAMGVTKGYIEEETAAIREKLKERYRDYYKNRSPQNLKDKEVILVDDGIATGNTILITAEIAHRQGAKKIIIAVPVAPTSTVEKLKNSAYIDEVVCLDTPYDFKAVGQFYSKFPQVSDREAIALLEGTSDKWLK